MERGTAVQLLHKHLFSDQPEVWFDLGCGSGTFTRALASLLKSGSRIVAVDRQSQNFPPNFGEVELTFYRTDFVRETLDLPQTDGILMANSLHYIKDKTAFIRKMEPYFKAKKQFLIVEYEREDSNPWVPYPITSHELTQLFSELHYTRFQKLGEIPSAFGGRMYSAFIGS